MANALYCIWLQGRDTMTITALRRHNKKTIKIMISQVLVTEYQKKFNMRSTQQKNERLS